MSQSLIAITTAPLPPIVEGKAAFDPKQIMARLRRAQAIRMPFEGLFQDCYDYALPARESFFPQGPGQERTADIFDETAVVSTQEFASRLQAGMTPNFARWAEFVAGSEVPPKDRQSANAKLEEVTDYVFEVLQNSNFAQEINEAYQDLAVGTACLDICEGDALNPVRFRAIPMPQLFLDAGPDDAVDFIGRLRRVKASNLKAAYPNCTLPADLQAQLDRGEDSEQPVLDATWRDWATPATEMWHEASLLMNHAHVLVHAKCKGTGSGRYVVFRWSKAAGEVWGRGPLFNALPAIRTANTVVQYTLENAAMAITGVYQMEDDGVVAVDNVKLVPGTIIPVAPGSGGLKAVGTAGNFDVSQLILSDLRHNIKRALFNEMLGNPDRTPMSATEVTSRMADLSRQIGAAFGRLQAELVNPVLRRVVYILKKQGRIKLPVVNGREVKVQAASPLAQTQNFQDVQSVDRFLEMVGARFGPQLVNVLVKSEEAVAFLATKFGVPDKLIRTDEERKALMQQMAAVMGQQNNAPEQPPPGGPLPGM